MPRDGVVSVRAISTPIGGFGWDMTPVVPNPCDERCSFYFNKELATPGSFLYPFGMSRRGVE